MEYFIFAKILDAKPISLSYKGKTYIFFVDKKNIIHNVKYSKEVLLGKQDFCEIVKILLKSYNIRGYKFYYGGTCEKVLSYNIIFYYGKSHIQDSTVKYINRVKKRGVYSMLVETNNTNIEKFYELWNEYSMYKGFCISNIEFIKELLSLGGENFYLVNTYNKEGSLIGSTVLLRFEDKVMLMYGGYNKVYIKYGLKYYINNFIIETFEKDINIQKIVFGTGRDEQNPEDSLLEFKAKFGDFYTLNTFECYSE